MIKNINKIFGVVLILFGLYYLIEYSIDKNITKILTSLVIPILVILPKFIKDKINDKLIFIYYFYIFILLILGCLAKFYSIYKYYDIFAHFMFGFLASIIALYLLNYFKIQNKNIVFNIIFIISITLSLASLWEIIEYILSIITKSDVQDVLKTGVRDTMEDIIASLTACSLLIIVYLSKKEELNKLVKPIKK